MQGHLVENIKQPKWFPWFVWGRKAQSSSGFSNIHFFKECSYLRVECPLFLGTWWPLIYQTCNGVVFSSIDKKQETNKQNTHTHTHIA